VGPCPARFHVNEPAGSYYVRASASTYVNQLYKNIQCAGCDVLSGETVTVTASDATAGIDFALVKTLGGIGGAITEAGTGTPLQNVFAYVYNSSGVLVGGASTNGSGQYTVPGLTSESYYVTASGQGYIRRVYNDVPCMLCTINSGSPVAVASPGTTGGIDFALSKGGGISGTVTSAALGSPIAQVLIEVYDLAGVRVDSRLTNASGQFSVTGLESGTYFVRASGKAYRALIYQNTPCGTCSVTSGAPVVVGSAGAMTTAVDFSMSPAFRGQLISE
jgi:hypothetical protein